MLYAILHITQKHIYMSYCFYFKKLGCVNILISFLRNKNFILSASKFKECFGLKQASDCYEEGNYNLLMIFRSEWTKLKYTLKRCSLLHSTKFQSFFLDSKVNCQIHMITDMFKNIWKEYFIKECFWSERNFLCMWFYRLTHADVR